MHGLATGWNYAALGSRKGAESGVSSVDDGSEVET
jgi:hypothetical protein